MRVQEGVDCLTEVREGKGWLAVGLHVVGLCEKLILRLLWTIL